MQESPKTELKRGRYEVSCGEGVEIDILNRSGVEIDFPFDLAYGGKKSWVREVFWPFGPNTRVRAGGATGLAHAAGKGRHNDEANGVRRGPTWQQLEGVMASGKQTAAWAG